MQVKKQEPESEEMEEAEEFDEEDQQQLQEDTPLFSPEIEGAQPPTLGF